MLSVSSLFVDAIVQAKNRVQNTHCTRLEFRVNERLQVNWNIEHSLSASCNTLQQRACHERAIDAGNQAFGARRLRSNSTWQTGRLRSSSWFWRFTDVYDMLWKMVIRPPRDLCPSRSDLRSSAHGVLLDGCLP